MKTVDYAAVTLSKWRVICPACSKWSIAETAMEAERKFEDHRKVEHPLLATSVRAIQNVMR